MSFPRTRAVVEVAAALLLLTAGAWLLLSTPLEKKEIPTATSEPRYENSTVRPLSSTDTDGDGIFDWEEKLRGTDPTNPDTDGDRTSDGEEVRTGRNPLIAGPNDAEHEVIRRLQDLRRPVSLFTQRARPSIPSSGRAPLRVTQRTTQTSALHDALRDYGNALGRAIAAHALPVAEELALWNHTVGTTTALGPEITARFRALSAGHDATARDLISAVRTAPTKEAGGHGATLADSYRALAESVLAIAAASEKGRIDGNHFMRYSDAAIQIGETIITIGRFFAAQGVRFAPNEPGSIFALP